MCPFCPHNYGFGFGPIAFWVGAIISILFWVAIIYFIYLLIKKAGWLQKSEDKDKDTALKILEERFAKGEIDQREFEERRKLLK